MAGGVYGADVEQLRLLGDRLEHAADALERAGGVLEHAITAANWQGPDASVFCGAWVGSLHPQVNAAAAALRAAARAVRTNAGQQESASRADSSAAVGGVDGRSGALPPANALPDVDGARPFGLGEMLAEPFLGVTEGVPLTWGHVVGFIPVIGTIASGIVLGEDLVDPSLSGGEKAYRTTGTVWEGVAGVLRGSGHPIAYGVGVAMSQWHDVADAARDVDFSLSGVSMVFDEVARDPWGSAVAASDAIVGSLGDIVDNFVP